MIFKYLIFFKQNYFSLQNHIGVQSHISLIEKLVVFFYNLDRNFRGEFLEGIFANNMHLSLPAW